MSPHSPHPVRRSPRRQALLMLLVGTTLAGGLSAGTAGAATARPGQSAIPAHHPSLVLVSFQPGLPQAVRDLAHARMGANVEHHFDQLNTDVVRIAPGDDPVQVVDRYRTLQTVVAAEPNWVFRASSDDPYFRSEWGLENVGQDTAPGQLGAAAAAGSSVPLKPGVDIDARQGWEAAFGAVSPPGNGGARVGIIDTGIDRMHPDLIGKTQACASALSGTGSVVVGYCTDDYGHGTHVAGTVAALAGNGIGVAGVAPNAELAIFKALNSAGSGFMADVLAGIQWLRSTGGATIISMSLGAPRKDRAPWSAPTPLDMELSAASAAGVVLIAAAGNTGDAEVQDPAGHPDVMSVSSMGADGARSDFSTCNDDVEIGAPGNDIWSTAPGGGYRSMSGTSMAAPHVAGVAAMVAFAHPGSNRAEVRRALLDGATRDAGCNGALMVNLRGALGVPIGRAPSAGP